MAIDTPLKRRSAGSVSRRHPGTGVTPDITKPAAWRQSAAWGYAGIAAGAPVVDALSPCPVTFTIAAKPGFTVAAARTWTVATKPSFTNGCD